MKSSALVRLQIVWAFHIGAHTMYFGSGKITKNFETCPLVASGRTISRAISRLFTYDFLLYNE
jgi:hypothetical protein